MNDDNNFNCWIREDERTKLTGWENETYPRNTRAKIVVDVTIVILMLSLVVISFFMQFQGFNLLSISIFLVTTFVYLIAFSDDGNTSELKQFRTKEVPNGSGTIYRAWGGMRSPNAYGVGRSWASRRGYYYAISFSEKEFYASNIKQVHETVQRTPSIVWMNSMIWIFISILCLILNFVLYPLVYHYYDRADIREFIFYLPSVMALISSIACLVFRKTRHRILHACAMRVVEDNYATKVRLDTIEVIEDAMSSKWFYDRCPNCGSIAPKDVTACQFCGSSLEVLSESGMDPDTVHRLLSANNEG